MSYADELREIYVLTYAKDNGTELRFNYNDLERARRSGEIMTKSGYQCCIEVYERQYIIPVEIPSEVKE